MLEKGSTFKMTAAESERFWSRVEVRGADECWLWGRGDNYGRQRFRDKTQSAHRLSWAEANGVWPRLCILHKCDVPACCNPAHLYEGTLKQNTRDCIERGRWVRPRWWRRVD